MRYPFFLSGVACLLVACVVSPSMVARWASADGTIENFLTLSALWLLAAAVALLGLGAIFVHYPAVAGRPVSFHVKSIIFLLASSIFYSMYLLAALVILAISLTVSALLSPDVLNVLSSLTLPSPVLPITPAHVALVVIVSLLVLSLITAAVLAKKGPDLPRALRTWRRLRRILVLASVPAGIGIGVAVGVYGMTCSRINILSELDPDHSVSARLLETNDDPWNVLWDQLRTRRAIQFIKPYQIWMKDPSKSNRRAEELATGYIDFGAFEHLGARQYVFAWRPGERIEWASPTPPGTQFYLQRQSFLFELLENQTAIPESAAIEITHAFVEEWARSNSGCFVSNPFLWNDDAMANRIQLQLLLMERRREKQMTSLEEEKAFLVSTLKHADRLADESYYNNGTNHGIMQNCALLAISLAYPELIKSKKWQTIAMDRMARHFREAVSPEGVYMELSPLYHWYAMRMALWYVATCRDAGINLDPEFEQIIRKMAVFAREILNPDGSLPIIGDTRPGVYDLSNWPWEKLPDWPELDALRQRLAAPNAAADRSTIRLWPRSGYFVLRTPPVGSMNRQSMMLTLKCGPRTRAHEHYDALSITLFGRGRPLLAGPGDYRDEERVKRIATTSQNTVSIDGQSQKSGAAEIVFSEIKRWGEGEPVGGTVAIQGESKLYEDVTHRRTAIYGPREAAVLIIDEILSTSRHTYRQHFRIAPNLEVSWSDSGSIHLSDRNKSKEGSLLRVKSWACVGKRVFRPEHEIVDEVVSFATTGKKVTYVTLLDCSLSGNLDTLDVSGNEARWVGELGTVSIKLPIASSVAVRWTN